MRNSTSHMLTTGAILSLVTLAGSITVSAAPLTIGSYAYDGAHFTPNGAYPDSGGTELNDNTIAPFPFTDPAWVGFSDPAFPSDTPATYQPQITFTLPAVYELNNVAISYLRHFVAINVDSPDSVDISYSLDDVTYSVPVNYSGFAAVDGVHTTLINLGGAEAQYVRIGFNNDFQWGFLTEIDFDGQEPAVIPEPASLLLLGLGAIGALTTARRRRSRS